MATAPTNDCCPAPRLYPNDSPIIGAFEDVTNPAVFAENRFEAPFKALRDAGGIQFFEDARFGPYWAITTYKPIQYIESLPKVFSSEGRLGGITVAGAGEGNLLPFEVPMPMFIAMDPPRHAGQRRTVAPAFGPSPVADMRADAEARTAEILDGLPIGKAFDWVERVSIELTTGMLARLFDFPWEERHKLTRWSDWGGDIEAFTTEELRKERLAEMMEMGAAFHALWESKKGKPPSGDLISMMLNSEAMADMSDQEFMGNLILLIVGGNDTTRNSMSAYAYGLNKYPEERAKLEADPPHLLILDTKCGKSRVVVLHPSTADHLRTYVTARMAALRGRAAAAFFTTLLGRRLNYTSTGVTFRRLLHHAGIQAAPGQRAPSLHSFRHTFAVNRLTRWHRERRNVQEWLPHLSVYLGHLAPANTYWYISGTPALLQTAAGLVDAPGQEGGGQ